MRSDHYPSKISRHLVGMNKDIHNNGKSKATVIKFYDENKTYYLKIYEDQSEYTHEIQIYNWLKDQLPVPKVVSTAQDDKRYYFLLEEANGTAACSKENLDKPNVLVSALAGGILRLQSLDVTNCPCDFSLKYKLESAKYNIQKGDVNIADWEESISFATPWALYQYLDENRVEEELVFSHGDYCLQNLFLDGNDITGYIDLSRSGVADKWQDIALCVRSIRRKLKDEQYVEQFFDHLGMDADYEKINYYILMDELF